MKTKTKKVSKENKRVTFQSPDISSEELREVKKKVSKGGKSKKNFVEIVEITDEDKGLAKTKEPDSKKIKDQESFVEIVEITTEDKDLTEINEPTTEDGESKENLVENMDESQWHPNSMDVFMVKKDLWNNNEEESEWSKPAKFITRDSSALKEIKALYFKNLEKDKNKKVATSIDLLRDSRSIQKNSQKWNELFQNGFEAAIEKKLESIQGNLGNVKERTEYFQNVKENVNPFVKTSPKVLRRRNLSDIYKFKDSDQTGQIEKKVAVLVPNDFIKQKTEFWNLQSESPSESILNLKPDQKELKLRKQKDWDSVLQSKKIGYSDTREDFTSHKSCIEMLCQDIYNFGQQYKDGTAAITFDQLFKVHNRANIVGTIMKGKSHGILYFDGEILTNEDFEDDGTIVLRVPIQEIQKRFEEMREKVSNHSVEED